ncbi:CHAD domain-containing protein [Streptomyces sp. NPDC052016]|uniref:CHAD domain-containing protein n=1 Tax=Streptomyces sp. NPDC052016 TaxID=3365680 RepID=UPI0037D4FA51
MAQQHHDLTDSAAGPVTTGDALEAYLRAQATGFLRALRLYRETGGAANGSAGTGESVDAARALRRSARRISGSLHTFRPLLDPGWSEEIRPELAWVSGTLALEHACEARLERLLLALHRLSGATAVPVQTATAGAAGVAGRSRGSGVEPGAGAGTGTGTPAEADAMTSAGAAPGVPDGLGALPPAGAVPGAAAASAAASVAVGRRAAGPGPVQQKAAAGHPAHPAVPDRGNLTVGAAKAGALLDRQLTLARTRAHSTALQALGSSRFHAVADKVAVLASEVPLLASAATTDLRPLAAAAEERLRDAVSALPLVTAGLPYNAEALVHGLSPDPAPHPHDAPWHQVRLLLRLHRYALEVLHGGADSAPLDVRLLSAGQALDRHRDASEAAAAAAQAARTPRIAPATAYALGVLHADQRHDVEAARYAFQRSWQKQTIGTSTS